MVFSATALSGSDWFQVVPEPLKPDCDRFPPFRGNRNWSENFSESLKKISERFQRSGTGHVFGAGSHVATPQLARCSAFGGRETRSTGLQRCRDHSRGVTSRSWLDSWASRSRLRPFLRVARTIRKYRDGILAYIDFRLTNGPVEGINNRMRTVARRAFGFHSAEALISMLFLCCSKIDLTPALPGFHHPLGI
jgi:transposase